jgi:uncharacterized protein YodC (DUF2158 family)
MIRMHPRSQEVSMADLNVGDAVKLKSGGPLMTVKEFAAAHAYSASDAPRDHVICQWFDEKQICKMARFPVESLELN